MSNYKLLPLDQLGVLNFYTKYKARGNKFSLANTTDFNTIEVNESWRFPQIQTHLDESGSTSNLNKVTFIFDSKNSFDDVKLIGSFGSFYEPISLINVNYEDSPTNLFSVSIELPVGQSYYYKFLVNGIPVLDPVNPQTTKLSNGNIWSFFFTDYFNYTNEFDEWEVKLLQRLANQIILFRTEESQNFIDRFYLGMAKNDRMKMPIYKLDDSVGEVNYITNILAREERHHLNDYKICLSLINDVLKRKNPFVESWNVSSELIDELYNEMTQNSVPGWDYSRYNNPIYFLTVLRRHTITGTFCHPRYGGNIGYAGWNYLKERYADFDTKGEEVRNYFNWDLSLEKPFGKNIDYKG